MTTAAAGEGGTKDPSEVVPPSISAAAELAPPPLPAGAAPGVAAASCRCGAKVCGDQEWKRMIAWCQENTDVNV